MRPIRHRLISQDTKAPVRSGRYGGYLLVDEDTADAGTTAGLRPTPRTGRWPSRVVRGVSPVVAIGISLAMAVGYVLLTYLIIATTHSGYEVASVTATEGVDTGDLLALFPAVGAIGCVVFALYLVEERRVLRRRRYAG